jgi:3-deoxy-D-manno-octulosonic-acid transferase
VEIVHPSVAIFIRYELWLNHLWALHSREIPTLLVCASAQNFEKKNSVVRSFNKSAFKNFTQILCVTESDVSIYRNNLDPAITTIVAGDTKYDRVIERARDARNNPLNVEKITAGKFVLVAGSTWGEDEEILVPAIKHLAQEHGERFLCILAPHEPTPQHLSLIETGNKCCRLSGIDLYNGESIIVVDSIGNLFALYQYANVVFIGGAFRQGVHNVLEPAVFGVPVLCGPQIGNAREAQDLVKSGGGHTVTSSDEIVDYCNKAINDPAFAINEGSLSKNFVESHGGATKKIVTALADMKSL